MLFFRSMPWYFIGCCLYHCLGCFLGYCSVYYLNYCQFVSHLVILEAERLFSLVCFSEPLGINIEEYKGLEQSTRLFIQICFGVAFGPSKAIFEKIIMKF